MPVDTLLAPPLPMVLHPLQSIDAVQNVVTGDRVANDVRSDVELAEVEPTRCPSKKLFVVMKFETWAKRP